MDIREFFLYLIPWLIYGLVFIAILYLITYVIAKIFKLQLRSPFDPIIIFGFILLPWLIYALVAERWPGSLPIIDKHWDKLLLAVISVTAYSLFNAYRLKKSSR